MKGIEGFNIYSEEEKKPEPSSSLEIEASLDEALLRLKNLQKLCQDWKAESFARESGLEQ